MSLRRVAVLVGKPGLGIGALLSAVALIVLSGCQGEPEAHGDGGPGATPETAVVVETRVLSLQAEDDLVEAGGTLRAAREATLAGKIMGTVVEIRKNAGDAVNRGDVLLVIDSRDVTGQIGSAQGALAQAKAAAALAESNFRRFEQLHSRSAASQLELDQARFQHETARGAVQQAEGAVAVANSYKAYAAIEAPFSGRVVDRLCEVGDLASPGRPLLRIEDTETLRLYASLDVSKGAAAEVGSVTRVRVPALNNREFSGTITEIVPAADPATHTLLLKIRLEPDPALRSGLFARAFLPVGARDALRIPRQAVLRRGGISGVFVAEEGHAAFRMVALADEESEFPRVLSGLREGDAILVNPPAGLEIGAPVEVRS